MIAFLLFLFLGALTAAPAGVQVAAQLNQHAGGPFESAIDQDPILAARRVRALNIARQNSLVADTDKLLRMARELNTEIAAADADSLTPMAAAQAGRDRKTCP